MLALAGLAGTGSAVPGAREARATVRYVVDGDTIRLTGGRYVRFLQIDAPELHPPECYGRRSSELLHSWLHHGSQVRLRVDPRLDRTDRYGRLLRYVFSGDRNLNLALVRRGAATVWFYDRDKGRYAGRLLTAAKHARRKRRGLWRACRAVWNPYGPATTYYKR
jgi:endonuclease YncB( thermonuclease family)